MQIKESYRKATTRLDSMSQWIKPWVYCGVGTDTAMRRIHSSESNATEVPDRLGMT